MALVAAFDPGVTTGVVVWDTEVGEFEYHAELTEDTLYPFVRRRVPEFSHVIIEWFQVSERTIRTQFVPDPIWHSGVIRCECLINSIPFSFSKTSDVMTRFNDKALRRAGLYLPGLNDHQRDATRHLCAYLRRYNLIDVERFLGGADDD